MLFNHLAVYLPYHSMSAHIHLLHFSTVSQYSIVIYINQHDFNRQKLCRLGDKGVEKLGSGKADSGRKVTWTKKESPGHTQGNRSSSMARKWGMYRIVIGGKEERERLWGLTTQAEKSDLNSVGSGEAFQFLQGKLMLQWLRQKNSGLHRLKQ